MESIIWKPVFGTFEVAANFGPRDYTGGDLVFADKKSPYYGTHNTKNKWFNFVGDTEHKVTPFRGTRYTLVCYRWT